MIKRKRIREKGKLMLSRRFQNLSEGDRVAVVRNLGFPAAFPRRIQGSTGIIVGRRGKAFVVKIGNKLFLIQPLHLKKLKT